jgi:hypothetical protein
MELIVLLILIAPFVLGYLLFKAKKENKTLQSLTSDLKSDLSQARSKLEKYGNIVDLDDYKDKLNIELEEYKSNIKELQTQKDTLKSEVLILDEERMLQEYGMYHTIFDLEDSEAYKAKLTKTQDLQKEMLQKKIAATCSREWIVEGSKAKGTKLTNDNIKLALRAFNGECDASISKVKYNNVVAMQTKIKKAYDDINKAMSSSAITISPRYLQLKLDELNITHELREKQYEEKEEQRRIKEEMREEEKAQRELEKAQKDAEQEEARYQQALEKARSEIEKTTGDKHDKLIEEIKKLEAQLLEAQERKQRAISQAQMTRSGHVYVISNIGSFGNDVYKIGMTRRLEPLDRVKELGDASVPFTFDVHAMIYSHDAPTLERQLHTIFNNKRVNMVNDKREFFNVTLDEIQEVVKANHGEVTITKLAEAKEYRETLAIRKELVEAS